jgi:hypothetical protein
MKIFRFLFVIFIFYFLFFISSKDINAQQVSLSLSPPLIETVIKPGKSILIAYTIINYGDPTILSAKVLPFEPKNNFGQIKIKEEFEGPIRFSLDNANFNLGQEFFLKTNDREQILLRIRVPEGTPEGDYYYTLLVGSQPQLAQEEKSASFAKATIGSNILITVTQSGKIDIKPKIVIFDVLSRFRFSFLGKTINFFDSTDLIPLVLVVENKGKNLIKPEGQIILKGNFGEKAKFDIVPQNILSQSQRLITATPSAEIDCSTLSKIKACQSPISLLMSGFFLGFYQLSTSLIFGENSPQISASTSFFAFPVKIFFGLMVVLVIAIFIIKRFKDEE